MECGHSGDRTPAPSVSGCGRGPPRGSRSGDGARASPRWVRNLARRAPLHRGQRSICSNVLPEVSHSADSGFSLPRPTGGCAASASWPPPPKRGPCGYPHPTVVSANPVDNTPHVLNGTVARGGRGGVAGLRRWHVHHGGQRRHLNAAAAQLPVRLRSHHSVASSPTSSRRSTAQVGVHRRGTGRQLDHRGRQVQDDQRHDTAEPGDAGRDRRPRPDVRGADQRLRQQGPGARQSAGGGRSVLHRQRRRAGQPGGARRDHGRPGHRLHDRRHPGPDQVQRHDARPGGGGDGRRRRRRSTGGDRQLPAGRRPPAPADRHDRPADRDASRPGTPTAIPTTSPARRRRGSAPRSSRPRCATSSSPPTGPTSWS